MWPSRLRHHADNVKIKGSIPFIPTYSHLIQWSECEAYIFVVGGSIPSVRTRECMAKAGDFALQAECEGFNSLDFHRRFRSSSGRAADC